MGPKISRRRLMQAMGAATFAPSGIAAGMLPGAGEEAPPVAGWCPEGPNTPKLSLGISRQVGATTMLRYKQIGIDHVLMGGPGILWEASQLKSIMARFRAGGLTVGNMMIGGFPKTIYGRPGRDEEIENVQKSIRAAGQAGLPVIEYNFYAHRLVEG